MLGFAFRCVVRASKATGHAVWVHFQETGYLMALGYLPQDETEDLENPEMREYEKDHAAN